MANRVVGNIIIVDSAMGNSAIIPGANLTDLHVNAIAFWSANTTSNITLTQADTATDLVYKFDYITNTLAGFPNPIMFAIPQEIDGLKVPRLTAGTAFLYLA